LGVELVRELRARDYAAMGWDRDEVDITDAAAVEHAIAGFDAEVVFNAAAYNQVDVAEEEPQAAFEVNALAVRNIALASGRWMRGWYTSRRITYSTALRTTLRGRRPHAPAGGLCGFQAGGGVVRAGVSGPGADCTHIGPLRRRRAGHGARQFRGADAAPGGFGATDPGGGRPRGVADVRSAAGGPDHRSGGPGG